MSPYNQSSWITGARHDKLSVTSFTNKEKAVLKHPQYLVMVITYTDCNLYKTNLSSQLTTLPHKLCTQQLPVIFQTPRPTVNRLHLNSATGLDRVHIQLGNSAYWCLEQIFIRWCDSSFEVEPSSKHPNRAQACPNTPLHYLCLHLTLVCCYNVYLWFWPHNVMNFIFEVEGLRMLQSDCIWMAFLPWHAKTKFMAPAKWPPTER